MTPKDFANRNSEVNYMLHYSVETGCMGSYETEEHVFPYDNFDDLLKRIINIRSGRENEYPKRGPQTVTTVDNVTLEIELTDGELKAIKNAEDEGDKIYTEEKAKAAEREALENQKKEKSEDEREFERLKRKLGK